MGIQPRRPLHRPSGAGLPGVRFRWLTPPANFHCPFGTADFAAPHVTTPDTRFPGTNANQPWENFVTLWERGAVAGLSEAGSPPAGVTDPGYSYNLTPGGGG